MVEVSTDKVDAEVPAPASGTVTKIYVQVDEEVEVGKPLADIDPNGGGAPLRPSRRNRLRSPPRRSPRSNPTAPGRPRRSRPPSDGKATTDDASVSAGRTLEGGGLEIVMPEMGESVTEGTVLEWHVSEGDQIARGRHRRRGLHRQGRRGGARARQRDDHQDPGRPRRDDRGRQAARRDEPRARAAETADAQAGRRRHPPGGCRGRWRRRNQRHARRPPRRGGERGRPEGLKGTGPGGKITKSDVLSGEGDGAAPVRRRRRGRGKAAARPRRDARQGDERESLDPDGYLVPGARRRHARRQAQGAQRGPQGAGDEGQLHPPDRLGDRQGRPGVAGDGARLRGARRQADRDRAGRRQSRHRGGRRAQGPALA